MGRCVVLHIQEKWLERLLLDALAAWGFDAKLSSAAPAAEKVGLRIVELPERPEKIVELLHGIQTSRANEIPLIGIVGNEASLPTALTYGASACLPLPIDLEQLKGAVEGLGIDLALTREARSRRN